MRKYDILKKIISKNEITDNKEKYGLKINLKEKGSCI